MRGKAYVIMAVGVMGLFVGVVYSIVASTNNMINEQTRLLNARVHGEISDQEYLQRKREVEHTYRSSVADSLERIESKFLDVVGLLPEVEDELNETNETNMTVANYSSDLEMVSGNLSEGIERLRRESIS
ncbi:MAG: hypothetical protein D6733_01015 [Methanobacteriota archaeon]|nr:MAG: hypothetical protein D6733_01015 [Euryarchaeota archaeon]